MMDVVGLRVRRILGHCSVMLDLGFTSIAYDLLNANPNLIFSLFLCVRFVCVYCVLFCSTWAVGDTSTRHILRHEGYVAVDLNNNGMFVWIDAGSMTQCITGA